MTEPSEHKPLKGAKAEPPAPDPTKRDAVVVARDAAEALARSNAVPEAEPVEEPAKPKKRRRRVWHWLFVWSFDIVVVCVVLVALAAFLLAGREVPAPQWLSERVEARLSEGLGENTLAMGAITVTLDQAFRPRVAFRDVTLTSADGTPLLRVPHLGARLDKPSLFAGRVQPTGLTVRGAELRLARAEDGNFNLGFGEAALMQGGAQSLEEVLAAIDDLFALPTFAPIESIRAEDLVLIYDDARAGQSWRIEDGTLGIEQTEDAIAMRLSLNLAQGGDRILAAMPDGAVREDSGAEETGPLAGIALSFTSDKRSAAAQLSAQITDVNALEISQQSPAFAFLSVLDAPVSGAMRGFVSADGTLGDISVHLNIGAGGLNIDGRPVPVRFDSGRTYFRYAPETGKLTFDDLQIKASQAEVAVAGHAYLEGLETGLPSALIAQLQVQKLWLDPEGMFARPAAFDAGALDLKLEFDPFRARLGQMVLTGPKAHLSATGSVTAEPEGLRTAIDFKADRLAVEDLLALWPLTVAPRTRDWSIKHVSSGMVHDAKGALRFDPGAEKPKIWLGYEFEDVVAQPLAALPPVTGAAGHASFGQNTFSVTLEAGQMEAPRGGSVDVAGTVFHLPQTQIKPVPAELSLQADGSALAVLSLLDVEAFQLIRKAGRSVDMVQGQVRGAGQLNFPLKGKLEAGELRYDVVAELTDVSSDTLVPGYALKGDGMELRASNDALSVSGPGTIAGLPFRASFWRPMGAEAESAPPRVEGTIQLSQRFVDTFNIGLPKGMVSGAGTGNFQITLPPGAAPRFNLRSDLNRMGLRIAELAWSKPANAKGSLVVAGLLGQVPRLDVLKLEAPGLSAEGSVTLNAGGGLKEARLKRVKAGRWIDAPVTLTGRGKGASPAVSVRGGWVDVRRTSFAQGGNGSGAGSPMTLNLDRLIISEGITLRGFKAKLSQRGGLNGTFTGSVNGRAPVTGELAPGKDGTAVQIRSSNAGEVFAAAGLFERGRGGEMQLVLTPRAKSGHYDGSLRVRKVRFQGSPGLAALLNTISVIGLLEQLNGPGLLLNVVEAEFRLTPTYVQLNRSSATGPSLGISMAGLYDLGRDQMKMQGVFSPIYVVNGIGQIFSKKGEGLIGMNYSMTGTAADPKVKVNPLSIFTPGMFREIFRRAPPKVVN